MHAAEIVVCEEERERRFVILPLLAVCVRQPRESANHHSHRLVRAFDMARANTVFVGFARDNCCVGVYHLGRTVIVVAVLRVRIHLDQLRKINALAHEELDRRAVWPEPVRRQLKSPFRRAGQLVREF